MSDDADRSPGRLELSGPATPEMLDLVHAVLERLWADHADVSQGDRARFETAVIEILGNIVEHAYRLDPSGDPNDRLRRRRSSSPHPRPRPRPGEPPAPADRAGPRHGRLGRPGTAVPPTRAAVVRALPRPPARRPGRLRGPPRDDPL